MFQVLFELGVNIINSLGYFGVFFTMMLESALIPIPSEAIMPLAGFLVSQGEMNFFIAVQAGAIGNLVGSIIAYGIGFYGGTKYVDPFVEKYGKYILLSKHEYDKAIQWTSKYGTKIAFFSRLVPGVRTVISLPLGIAKVNFIKFAVYTYLGALLWSAFLAFIGFKLGENWEAIGKYLHYVDFVILAIILGFIIYWFKKKLGTKSKKVNSYSKSKNNATQKQEEQSSG